MNELKLKDGDIVSFVVLDIGLTFSVEPFGKARYMSKYNYIARDVDDKCKFIYYVPVYVLHGKPEGVYVWESKGSFTDIMVKIKEQNKDFKQIKFVVCRKGRNYEDTFYKINVFPFESNLGLEMSEQAKNEMKQLNMLMGKSIKLNYLDSAIINGKIPEKNILTYKILELGE